MFLVSSAVTCSRIVCFVRLAKSAGLTNSIAMLLRMLKSAPMPAPMRILTHSGMPPAKCCSVTKVGGKPVGSYCAAAWRIRTIWWIVRDLALASESHPSAPVNGSRLLRGKVSDLYTDRYALFLQAGIPQQPRSGSPL